MSAKRIAAALACCVCWIVLALCTARLWRICPLVSARLNVPMTQAQQQSLTAALRESGPAEGLRVAFWSQSARTVRSRWHTCTAAVLTFSGTPESLYPAPLLRGRLPDGAQAGCAVSDALADMLWGSADILGQPVWIGETLRPVTGVFRDSMPLLLCTGRPGQSYENMEFTGMCSAPPAETVRALLDGAAAAQASAVCFPFPCLAALTFLTACPPLLWLAGAVCRRIPRACRGAAAPWAVMGLAILLPCLITALPAWATPRQGSDFAWWAGLPRAVWESVQAGFALRPLAKDILIKNILLCAVCAGTLCAFFAGRATAPPGRFPCTFRKVQATFPRREGVPFSTCRVQERTKTNRTDVGNI